MPMLHRLAILALLAPGVFAAQKEPEKDSAGAQTSPAPAVEPASKDVDVADLMRQAAAGLDRMEAGVDDATAKALLEKAVILDSGNIDARFLMGRIFLAKKDYNKAVEEFSHVTKLNPGFAEALFNLGYIHAVTGDYPKAETFYEKAARLSPPFQDLKQRNMQLLYTCQDLMR